VQNFNFTVFEDFCLLLSWKYRFSQNVNHAKVQSKINKCCKFHVDLRRRRLSKGRFKKLGMVPKKLYRNILSKSSFGKQEFRSSFWPFLWGCKCLLVTEWNEKVYREAAEWIIEKMSHWVKFVYEDKYFLESCLILYICIHVKVVTNYAEINSLPQFRRTCTINLKATKFYVTLPTTEILVNTDSGN